MTEMDTGSELTRRTGHELAAGLRSGAFSAAEVTAAHLAAAERDNHGLHAWLSIDGASRPGPGGRRGRPHCRGPAGRVQRPSGPCPRSSACPSP